MNLIAVFTISADTQIKLNFCQLSHAQAESKALLLTGRQTICLTTNSFKNNSFDEQ